MKIKVCGMTKATQIQSLGDLGVDFIGFIFYEKSSRYVLNHLKKNEIKHIGGTLKKVGVFVNEDPYTVLNMVDSCGLDIVQLHGSESPEYCERLLTKAPVIKAFSIDGQTDIRAMVQPFQKVATYFMFDTATKYYGGSGKKFDWKAIADVDIGKPFILSGGISPQDAEILDTFSNFPVAKDLHAIDINSRFETEPGVKDLILLEKFLKQLKERNYAE